MSKRIALVTGVVGKIGAAIAERLAFDGAHVVVTDIEGAQLDKVSATLGLQAIAADLGNRAEVANLVEAIARDHGAPSILVNAAGGVRGQVH